MGILSVWTGDEGAGFGKFQDRKPVRKDDLAEGLYKCTPYPESGVWSRS